MSERRLSDLALSETGFVFDPFTGATFTVNQTGLCVLHALRDGLGREQVLERMRESFVVPRGVDPERDLDEFLQLLRHHGVLDEAEGA